MNGKLRVRSLTPEEVEFLRNLIAHEPTTRQQPEKKNRPPTDEAMQSPNYRKRTRNGLRNI